MMHISISQLFNIHDLSIISEIQLSKITSTSLQIIKYNLSILYSTVFLTFNHKRKQTTISVCPMSMHSIGQSIKSSLCPSVRARVRHFLSYLPSTFPFPFPFSSLFSFPFHFPFPFSIFLPLSTPPFSLSLSLLLTLFLPLPISLPFPLVAMATKFGTKWAITRLA